MRAQRGFSLIEVLMAVLIAGVVAAIAIPVFNGQRTRARDHAARSEVERTYAAAHAIVARTETVPADIAARVGQEESTANVIAGTAYEQDRVNVDRPANGRVILRSLSKSGAQQSMDIRYDASGTRLWTTRSWVDDLGQPSPLDNADLENTSAAWTADWQVWTPTPTRTGTIVTSGCHSGGRCLQASTTDGGYGLFIIHFGAPTTGTVVDGETWRGSMWVRNDTFDTSAYRWQISLRVSANSVSNPCCATFAATTAAMTPPGTWTQLRTSAVVPAGTTEVGVQARAYRIDSATAAGDFAADDAFVARGAW